MCGKRTERAFTLVELLVVITIIGILIALLLPAVQAAREAARMTQCKNNLRQLALGFMQHEERQKVLPSGGWGYTMVGDPNRGFGKRQPGGFGFAILPFIEQQELFNLGYGAPEGSTAQRVANDQRIQTPLAIMYCPTRRRVMLYPITSNAVAPWSYCDVVSPVARCDYAACCGDTTLPNDVWFPSSFTPYASVDSSPSVYWGQVNKPYLAPSSPLGTTNYDGSFSGISFRGSEIKMSDITDGAAYTYMLGEKYIDVDEYNTGWSWGDDQCAYIGWDQDNHRISLATYQGLKFPPMQDVSGYDDEKIYGSPHNDGFNMAFCDGSVHTMNFSIDPETHRRLGTRAEGLRPNTNAF